MSIEKHLEEKSRPRRTGRTILLFILTVCAVFTSLFPFFSIVLFAIMLAYLLLELKHVIEWQTKKTYCKKCKEEHHIA